MRRTRYFGVVSASLALTVAVGSSSAFTTTAAAASVTSITPVAEARAPAHAAKLYGLPTGDRVQVSGTGDASRVHFIPAPGRSSAAVTTVIGGQVTVVPVDGFRGVSSLDPYRVVSKPAAVTPNYAMVPLDVKAVDHEGVPAAAAEIVVVNTDDPARANWDGIMTGGDARIQVPAGHYSVAVAIFDTDAKGASTETDLLTVTDVTVSDPGTTVTLDGRTAQQLSFTTPKASVPEVAAVGWIRGVPGKLDSLSIGALAGTRFYVGAAAKAQHGVMQFSVVGRQNSPAAASPPYSYIAAIPKVDQIPANQTYAVSASSLATFDDTYVTDTPSQDLMLSDGFLLAGDGPDDPVLPDLPWTTTHAPATDRRFVSASANLVYDGLMLPVPNAFLDGELERLARPKAGDHLYLTWRGGLTVPAPSNFDGPCFLCREGNVLHGVGVMDTDASGDVGQWSDGPTTLTEDGKTVYTGTTLGTAFDQTLPAAAHKYVYSIDTTHDTSESALATHSKISWGFTSKQVTTSTVPASYGCSPCAPLPILYANAWFEADGHESVAGSGVFDADLLHQPYAADPATTSAAVDVSYDDGATWKPLTVTLTGGGHHIHGTWSIPSTIPAGYLAVRIHAADSAGSTLDETVSHAALVNAPHGIALPAGGTTGPGGAGDAGISALCPSVKPGFAHCLALVNHTKSAAALPAGLARADLLSAYKLPATGGAGRTVAIVDAHDDPTAEADLAAYRKAYGLPACTTANGCFKKVNQNGATSPLPAYDPADDWSGEVSLDVDMVSAVCPDCHILLVESDDASTGSMAAAERAATGSGAVAVSNSWGSDESTEAQAFTSAFQHAGVAVTVASGDAGFQQAAWPASLANVITVGGTSLTKASATTRGWKETAWAKAGSGCSAYVAKPSWQKDTHCPARTASDISAVADPHTGLAVYVQGDWAVFGGTSASSPIIAAMIALAGNSAKLTSAQYIYQHAANLFDVTSGSNAHWDCGGDYLCTAVKGYDGPTGMGTPNGLGGL